MQGRGEKRADKRPVVYCIVPRELAPKLHEPLRRHFRDDPAVDVVVERRGEERREPSERRSKSQFGGKRVIRGRSGRRLAERRALVLPIEQPELPRRLRAYAGELTFVERLEPSRQRQEDLEMHALVMRIQAGDTQAFSDLYMRNYGRVYSYLRIVLKDPHGAEDLTQQVFIKALEALPRYERREQPFRAWLFAIVRNTMLTELDKRSRIDLMGHKAMSEEAEGPVDGDLGALDWITDSELVLFIERLPLPQQQVLLLRYMLDLTHEQTAAVLGRSTNEVRKMQQRAFDFLRARLTAVGRRATRRAPSDCSRPLTQIRVLRDRRFALLRR